MPHPQRAATVDKICRDQHLRRQRYCLASDVIWRNREERSAVAIGGGHETVDGRTEGPCGELSESSSDKLGEELSPRSQRIRELDEQAKRRKTREGKREGERKVDREDKKRKRVRGREDVRAQALATRWTRGRHIDPRFHNLHPFLASPPLILLPLLPFRPSPPPSPPPPTPLPRPPARYRPLHPLSLCSTFGNPTLFVPPSAVVSIPHPPYPPPSPFLD